MAEELERRNGYQQGLVVRGEGPHDQINRLVDAILRDSASQFGLGVLRADLTKDLDGGHGQNP